MNTEIQSPGQIASIYKNVIKAWKNLPSVQNGFDLAYRKGQNPKGEIVSKPYGIGDGLGTTGFCVSASQAFLMFKPFQLLLQARGAKAKLVSIDIKEQYYGFCIPSYSQNKWHTAIFVQDSGLNIIIDLTCRQFGNKFINKDIWDFETWEDTFRHPLCRHKITDFEGNELKTSAVPVSTKPENKDFEIARITDAMHDIISISDDDRIKIANFITRLSEYNEKLIIGNVNKFDYKLFTEIEEIFKHFYFIFENSLKNPYYAVLEFTTKNSAKEWIKKFLENRCALIQYLAVSETIDLALQFAGIPKDNFNKERFSSDLTYVCFEFKSFTGIDFSFIPNLKGLLPFGTVLNINPKNIKNGGRRMTYDTQNSFKDLNTIWITVDSIGNLSELE